MREIKFRAWTGKEIHDDFLMSDSGDIYIEKYCEYGAPMDCMADWKLMQYTGKLDENDKEIYEGDILLSRDYDGGDIYAEVKYDQEDACFSCFDDLLSEWNQGSEVVGNIYENPELLN